MPKIKNSKVIVVIPAFNEAGIIAETLTGLSRVFGLCSLKLKVIIVDDGSSDNTVGVAKSHRDIDLRVIRQPTNLGPGAAFRVGLSQAIKMAGSDDFVVTMEADNTAYPGLIIYMIDQLLRGAHVVCASRHIQGGVYQDFPLLRQFFSIGANKLLHLLFPIHGLTDYTIFFRTYRASVLKKVFAKYRGNIIQSAGFVGNVELLLKLNRLNINFSEVPLVYAYKHRRGKSRMKITKNIVEYINFIYRMKHTGL